MPCYARYASMRVCQTTDRNQGGTAEFSSLAEYFAGDFLYEIGTKGVRKWRYGYERKIIWHFGQCITSDRGIR